MAKVMMPVEVETWKGRYGPKFWRWALAMTCGSSDLADGESNTEAEALAAAKEWVLGNGGTWEEENG